LNYVPMVSDVKEVLIFYVIIVYDA